MDSLFSHASLSIVLVLIGIGFFLAVIGYLIRKILGAIAAVFIGTLLYFFIDYLLP